MQHGFSLVELSIVLVILGLLTGGILAGQSLIRASELRSVDVSLQKYEAAFHSFRDKYFALPGDMTNATKFWDVRAGTGSDIACHQTINTYTGTCNGNGDGVINGISGDATNGEVFAFWQHLAYAGLIEGRYTGASASASAVLRSVNVNLPAGKLGNSMFLASSITGGAPHFPGTPATNIYSIKSTADAPILRPEEQWNLDTKRDDGLPGLGRVRAYMASSGPMPGCATGDTTSATYALSDPSVRCYPIVFIQ